MGEPAMATGAPEKMPKPFTGTFEETRALVSGVADGYGIPTLEDLGYEALGDDEGFPARGGETEGLIRLRKQLARTEWIAGFEKPNTNPTTRFHALKQSKPKPKSPFEIAAGGGKGENPSMDANTLITPSTTALSPYLKFGCVSPRTFYHELKAVLARAQPRRVGFGIDGGGARGIHQNQSHSTASDVERQHVCGAEWKFNALSDYFASELIDHDKRCGGDTLGDGERILGAVFAAERLPFHQGRKFQA